MGSVDQHSFAQQHHEGLCFDCSCPPCGCWTSSSLHSFRWSRHPPCCPCCSSCSSRCPCCSPCRPCPCSPCCCSPCPSLCPCPSRPPCPSLPRPCPSLPQAPLRL